MKAIPNLVLVSFQYRCRNSAGATGDTSQALGNCNYWSGASNWELSWPGQINGCHQCSISARLRSEHLETRERNGCERFSCLRSNNLRRRE